MDQSQKTQMASISQIRRYQKYQYHSSDTNDTIGIKSIKSIISPKSIKSIKSLREGMMFSYFKAPITNKEPYKEITLQELYQVIRDKKYFSKQTNYLRQLPAKEYKKEKTRLLDYVTFAGTFSNRADSALKKLSGLMCLDFDHLHNMEAKKRKLINDHFLNVQMIFVSPGGDGLKAIISNPHNSGDYSRDYKAVTGYAFRRFGLSADKTSDVSRACFICHDPNAWMRHIEDGISSDAPIRAMDTGDKRPIPENASETFRKIVAHPEAAHLNYHPDLEASGYYTKLLQILNTK